MFSIMITVYTFDTVKSHIFVFLKFINGLVQLGGALPF